MITLTKEFRRALAANDRNYSARAVIVLNDNTRIELEGNEIWSDGFAVEDAVSDDESFTALGSAVINAATLIIDNTKDKYIGYDFINADVTMYISKTFGTRTEVIKMGTYRVDDTKYDEATITLSMLDMMEQFDRAYIPISFPATLGDIVRNACSVCLGSTSKLATQTFPHSDFIIQEAPADDKCTYREVISWCATVAGCFARCNRNGDLEIKWFNTAALENTSGTDGGDFDNSSGSYYQTGDAADGGTFSPWSTGAEADGGSFTENIPMHYVGSLYSQTICVDETVITGVKIDVDNPDPNAEEKIISYTRGTAGYVIQVEKVPFITTDNVNTIIDWLEDELVGLRFRKCNVTHADDPSIEAGDVGLLYDSRQREYPILITRHAFEIGGPQTIVCGCETPARNQATRFTAATKAYVENRKLLKQQKDSYEEALAELAEDIENNAHGLYAEEIEDPDDPNAKIYCLHDKPRIDDSNVQIRLSTVGIVVTSNGTAQTPTWYGLRVNGDMITRIMQTIGISFDWGVGGELQIKKGTQEVFYVDADTGVLRITAKKNNSNVFYVNSETGQVDIVANSFSLSSGDTIQSIAESKAASAAAAAVNGQTQQSIFNKLTKNGQTQGIYLQDGKLYLNGAYLQAGIINIKDENDVSTFYANTQTGVVHIVAKTFKLVSGDTTKTIPEIANERASAAVNAQTQESIFNKLTNNGETQGIYLDGGKLYINGEYIKAESVSANLIKGGVLKLGGSNNGNGKIFVYDESGKKIGEWTKDGLNATGNLVIRATPTYNVYGGTFSYRQYLRVEGYSQKVTHTGFAVEKTNSSGEQVAVFALDEDMGVRWRLTRSSTANLASIIIGDNTYDYNYQLNLNSSGLNIVRGRYNKPSSADARANMNDDEVYMYIKVDGRTVSYESSSSIRYKHDIKPIEDKTIDPHKLLELPVVQFEWNSDHPLQYEDMAGRVIPGIIAEDVEKIYPAATIHKDGKVESWDERRIIPGMLALIQEQDRTIKEQQARLDELEKKLESLTRVVEAYTTNL